MSEDPWADEREWRGWEGVADIQKKLNTVLTDADALLGLAREYRDVIRLEWVKAGEDGRTEQTLDEWIADWYPKLAALPAHLCPQGIYRRGGENG